MTAHSKRAGDVALPKGAPRYPVQVGPHECGGERPMMLIAGPCVIENRDLTLQIADRLAVICNELDLPLVFKASFDKANRTSIQSYRGAGIEAGLRILEETKRDIGLPVTTDVHEIGQATQAGEVCDLLQIPAFLARQTDLLLAAAATGRAVNVKKGQFMAPEDMRHVRDKLLGAGCDNILLTERGTFFGYGRLVNDLTGLVRMRQLGTAVVFDATHSVQQPGSLDGRTGGVREMIEPLARAAIAVGIDALFLETHPEPDRSPSDGPNMIPLQDLPQVLRRLLRIREATQATQRAVTA